MLDRLLSTIAPHICSSCGAENALLCEYCFCDIVDAGYDQCLVCLQPAIPHNLCGACRPSVTYDEAWVVGERSAGLKEVIDRYKFDRAREGARILGRLLAARVPVVPPETIVSYIPNVARHRRQRGYDHMALVARELASHKKLTVVPLLRRHTSMTQRGAARSERLTRQHGAFYVDQAITSPVLLIDDICTTGATITAGVEAIRAVSDHPIFVAVVARQPFER